MINYKVKQPLGRWNCCRLDPELERILPLDALATTNKVSVVAEKARDASYHLKFLKL